jgi:hypothetical protein
MAKLIRSSDLLSDRRRKVGLRHLNRCWLVCGDVYLQSRRRNGVLSRASELERERMDEITVSELEAKLKTATEALRVSEERATAGRLALEIMHEIRNPLEALGNLHYLCVQESKQPEKVEYFMRLAEEQLETSNTLPITPWHSRGIPRFTVPPISWVSPRLPFAFILERYRLKTCVW